MTEVAQFIEMTAPLPTKTGTSAMQFRIYTYKRDERFRSGDFATDDCAANQCSLKGTVSCARYKTTADVSDTFDNFDPLHTARLPVRPDDLQPCFSPRTAWLMW